MSYDTTTTVTNDVTDNLALYHNEFKTAIDHLMSAAAYAAYVNAQSMTGNVTLVDGDFPIQSFSPTAARNLTLPAVASTNHAFYVINRSGTYAITVKNAGGTTIVTVSAGGSAILLSDGSNGWYSVSGSGSSSGGELANHLDNPGFDRWERSTSTPTTAISMTDGVYNSPDRWYSLVQGSGATIERAAGIGTAQYSAKIIAGGTTNRYGIAQVERASTSIARRGKTVTTQFRIKPTNNAGSGSRDYRIAILEWTGTADTVTKDVVNDWTSGTYTTGNFFKSTNTTLVATATTTLAHGVEGVLSVSGAVSTSCNNLIVFVWVEDVPTHASDYAQFSEAGCYDTDTAQTWRAKDPGVDSVNCLKRFISYGGTASYEPMGVGMCYSTTLALIVTQFPVQMDDSPTIGYSNLSHWLTRTPGGSVAPTAISINTTGLKTCEIAVTVASGLTAGQATDMFANNTTSARITFDCDL